MPWRGRSPARFFRENVSNFESRKTVFCSQILTLVDSQSLKKRNTEALPRQRQFYAESNHSCNARGSGFESRRPVMAKQLDCEIVTFPGHHGSYMDSADEPIDDDLVRARPQE
jgi:hypothetical protein